MLTGAPETVLIMTMKSMVFLGLMVATAFGMGSVGCSNADELPYVSFETPLRPAAGLTGPPDDMLRVGASPLHTAISGYEQFVGLVSYLTAETGRSVAFVQRSTYYEVNEMVRSGDLAMAMISPGAYVLNGHGLEAIAVPVSHGEPTFRAVCVVTEDSPARRLEDLRGNVFGMGDVLSLSSRFYIEARLQELDTTPDEFFARIYHVEGQDSLLQLVASHNVDAACVSSSVLEQLAREDGELARAVRPVEQSRPFSASPVVVSSDIDPALKELLTRSLLDMDESDAGRLVLTDLGIDHFDVPAPGLYSDIEALLKDASAELDLQ